MDLPTCLYKRKEISTGLALCRLHRNHEKLTTPTKGNSESTARWYGKLPCAQSLLRSSQISQEEEGTFLVPDLSRKDRSDSASRVMISQIGNGFAHTVFSFVSIVFIFKRKVESNWFGNFKSILWRYNTLLGTLYQQIVGRSNNRNFLTPSWIVHARYTRENAN